MAEEPQDTAQNSPRFNVLFLANEAEEAHGIRELLEKKSCKVSCRESKKRGFQLMTVETFDVVISAVELQDGSGIDFCKDFRRDQERQNVPLLVIGEDDDQGTNCVTALEAGADDFVECPFIANVFLARVKRFLRTKVKATDPSSLSVQVSAGELPGVLQFLETEMKTGRLTVKSKTDTATIFLDQGRLVNARCQYCDGMETIPEMLSWEQSHVSFDDGELDPADKAFDAELTGVIMNSVVDVDEYKEIRSNFPPDDAMFRPGSKPMPKDADPKSQRIYDQLLTGATIDEVLSDDSMSLMQATFALHKLMEDEHLAVAKPPFDSYRMGCYKQYKNAHGFLGGRLPEIKKAFEQITFPIHAREGFLPIEQADWMTPAPKLIVAGDEPAHVSMFIQSLTKMYISEIGKKPPVKNANKGNSLTRLVFGDRRILDVQELPPTFTAATLRSLDDYLMEAFAVVFVASSQIRKAVQSNNRLIRQLRHQFRGVYGMVVPQVLDEDKQYRFRFDCGHCGYSLVVEMEQVGSIGECPICNAELAIPDPLDNLVSVLHLPDDVPVMMVQPDSAKHCRELLTFLIENVMDSFNPPAVEEVEVPVESVAVVETPNLRKPEPVAEAPAEEPVAAEPDVAEPEPEPVSELDDILGDVGQVAVAGQGQEDGVDDEYLDQIMTEKSDVFDIDDFIDRVGKVK